MIWRYRIDCPGNDLHLETFEVTATTREIADIQAIARLRKTFSWSSRTDARAVFVTSFRSAEAMRKADAADTLPAPAESSIQLTASDADAVLDVLIGDDVRRAGAS